MVGSLHAGIKNLDRFLGEKGMSFGVNQEERESLERESGKRACVVVVVVFLHNVIFFSFLFYSILLLGFTC